MNEENENLPAENISEQNSDSLARPDNDKEVERTARRKTIKSFIVWGAGMTAAFGIFKWIRNSPESDGAHAPLRKVLDWNEKVFNKFFSNKHQVKTWPREAAIKKPRTNGDDGLTGSFDPALHKVEVYNFNSLLSSLEITVDDLKKLPKYEITYEFKCIEGWEMITNWSGARFSDFINYYKLGTKSGKSMDINNPDDAADYVGLETPDGKYYVGIDMASALHPQTLLCYEMNNEPLPVNHGGPLRLIIPTKFGIKNLKRIGVIRFQNTRPKDFWFEQGYDYYAGL